VFNNFIFQQDGAPAHRSLTNSCVSASSCARSCETRKLAAE